MIDRVRILLLKNFCCSLGLVLATLIMGSSVVQAQMPSLIPVPARMELAAGTLTVRNGTIISYPAGDAAAGFAATHLVELLQRAHGLQLVVRAADTARHPRETILLERSTGQTTGQNRESYDLVVSPEGVKITAATGAGLYYGSVTLWQLLTASRTVDSSVQLQCVRIHDAPELPWRGIMLDSARHMQSVKYIKQLIDWMSLEKLNVLHWHLTDDQGWRLEIKRYPKLTSVGGYRRLPEIFASEESSSLKLGARYGGFYTQAEVRELVKYASLRNVMIVPEIEMPGHASASIAAYPEFGSTTSYLSAPVSEYGIFPNLYNIDDRTFTFLKNILTEVMELFPSPYIHVGGDEAIKDQWKASPAIQARMRQLGIGNEDALQSYFIKRIDAFLSAHQRRTLGWDEILEGGLAPNATVMSWHGIAGGIDAARQGHDAVLTPVRPLYFNYRQTDGAAEAPGRFALNTLHDVYEFNPLPASLTAEERKHILGVQANLWTEYVITEDRDTWMIFPRAAALAEIGWSPSKPRDWQGFSARLAVELSRYDKLGIKYDPNAFRVRSQETLEGAHVVKIVLSNQAGVGSIRYTLDGSPVTPYSPIYHDLLETPLPIHLKAATFLEDEIPGSELDRAVDEATVRTRYSQDLRLCTNDPAIAMEQDPPQATRPVTLTNYKQPCWIYRAANLDGVTRITTGVMALPYVFHDRNNQILLTGDRQSKTGEVQVYLDTCEGKLLTRLSLQSAAGHMGVTLLSSNLENIQGSHDLCFKVVRPTRTPLWSIYSVSLETDKRNELSKVPQP